MTEEERKEELVILKQMCLASGSINDSIYTINNHNNYLQTEEQAVAARKALIKSYEDQKAEYTKQLDGLRVSYAKFMEKSRAKEEKVAAKVKKARNRQEPIVESREI